MTYYFVAKKQKLVLQATSGVEVHEHAWYVNDTYLGKDRAGEKLFVAISPGEHTVTCIDDRGRATSVHIKIKYVL